MQIPIWFSALTRCWTNPICRRIAELKLESNSIYAYNNTVNRNRIVASWDGADASLQKFHARR